MIGGIRAASLILAMTLAVPAPLLAAPAITPESATDGRFPVEQEGKRLIDAGQLEAAAELYWTRGVELKDPLLIVESAEVLRDLATKERSKAHAQAAIDRVAPALDMLYFLRDSSTSASWQPIASEHVGTVLERADRLVSSAEQLIGEIEDEERRAAEAAAMAANDEQDSDRKRGPAKPGTGLIAGGAAAIVLGLGGAGLGTAGLVLGARAQSLVEHPLVYEEQHRAAEQQGHNANVMAGVGFAVAGVGVVVGATLIVLGVRKRKASASGPASATIVPVWMKDGAGIGVVGRF